MKPIENHILVELHVPDFDIAKEYYGRLGFEVAREEALKGTAGYLVLRMQDNVLCFWSGNESVYEQSYFQRFPRDTKRGYGVEIVFMVTGIEEYYERVKSSLNVVEHLRPRPWGLKDFRIEDPFGYYIRITEPHNIINKTKLS